MVTIRDVAASAGVGVATVSRVVNQHPGVHASTRARVEAAIAALGYRPNRFARALSGGRCQTVGVLVASFTAPSAVERLRGVVAALEGSAYDLVLFDVESPVHRDEHVRTIDRQRADGLLVMSLPLADAQLDELRRAGIVVVLVDGYHPDVVSVTVDDVSGGRGATELLLSLGHERIAFIGDAPDNDFGFRSSADRERGYRDALRGAGRVPAGGDVRYVPHDQRAAHDVALELLAGDDRPTAVFCCSDVQAFGVLQAARQLHLDVPADLSLVGYDDIEAASFVGLTTVHQPLFRSGQLGAELLLAALQGDHQLDATVHELPVELTVRSTTARAPAVAGVPANGP